MVFVIICWSYLFLSRICATFLIDGTNFCHQNVCEIDCSASLTRCTGNTIYFPITIAATANTMYKNCTVNCDGFNTCLNMQIIGDNCRYLIIKHGITNDEPYALQTSILPSLETITITAPEDGFLIMRANSINNMTVIGNTGSRLTIFANEIRNSVINASISNCLTIFATTYKFTSTNNSIMCPRMEKRQTSSIDDQRSCDVKVRKRKKFVFFVCGWCKYFETFVAHEQISIYIYNCII